VTAEGGHGRGSTGAETCGTTGKFRIGSVIREHACSSSSLNVCAALAPAALTLINATGAMATPP
jgi:hypothetical protein